MASVYEKGQKVLINPVKDPHTSPRDSTLGTYAGKIGTVVDVYWLNMGVGAQNISVYTVRVEGEDKDIVVHEDEIRAYLE